MKTLVIGALTVALHLVLGWGWTLLAGVVAGGWAERRPWLVGGAGVGIGWSALVGYNLAVAPGPVGRMLEVVGGLFGNLPGAFIVALTLMIGVLLGIAGSLLGTSLRHLLTK